MTKDYNNSELLYFKYYNNFKHSKLEISVDIC